MQFTQKLADDLIKSFNTISEGEPVINVVNHFKKMLLKTNTFGGSSPKKVMGDFADFLVSRLTDSAYKELFAPIMQLIQIHLTDDVNAKDAQGRTLLYYAFEYGDESIINFLISKYGADVDASQTQGDSNLLHLAVMAGDAKRVEQLIKYGANIHIENKMSHMPLFLAVAAGDFEIVELLVKHGANVNAKNTQGMAPLHGITKKTPIEIVRFLIKKGADANVQDNLNRTPAYFAAFRGEADVLEVLIKDYKTDKHAVDKNGLTLLHCAAENHNPDVAHFLIVDCKIAVDVQKKPGALPLDAAASRGVVDTFVYLIQEMKKEHKKFDVNNRERKYQRTLLHLAAEGGKLNIVRYLLETEKANLDVQDERGETALHLAARCGHSAVVAYLVNTQKAKVDVPDKFGAHPLHYAAAYSKDIRMVQCLMEAGADVNAKDRAGSQPWHYAAQNENVEILRCLIQEPQKKDGFDINVKTNNENTALHRAAEAGRLDAVKFLHEEKSNINAKNIDDRTALHLAAFKGKHAVVKYLVNDCKMDINIPDKNGDLPLHLAVQGGDLETVKFLVQKTKETRPRDLEILGNRRKTPLLIAATNGHLALVAFFLEQEDVALNARDKDNNTALHLAVYWGHPKIVAYLVEKHNMDITAKGQRNLDALKFAVRSGRANVVKYLMEECGANFDSNVTIRNQTALHWAADLGYLSVVEYLVKERKIDVNVKDKFGVTPLGLASENNHVKVMKFLVEQGANLNPQDAIDNQSALHWAAKNGYRSVVENLIKERKIDVNVKDNLDVTPLHLASKNGHVEAMRCLIEHGADINAQDICQDDDSELEGNDGTPLHEAVNGKKVDAVRLLLKAGADPDIENTRGNTPYGNALEYSEIEWLCEDFLKDADRAKEIYQQVLSIRVSAVPDDIIPPLKNIIQGYVDIVGLEEEVEEAKLGFDLNKKIIVVVEEALVELVVSIDKPKLTSKIEAAVNNIISRLRSEHCKAESRIYWNELKKEFQKIRRENPKNISKSFMKAALAKVERPSKLPSGPLASLASMSALLGASSNPVASSVKSEVKESKVASMEVDEDEDEQLKRAIEMSLAKPLPMDQSSSSSSSSAGVVETTEIETKTERKHEVSPAVLQPEKQEDSEMPPVSSSSSSFGNILQTMKQENNGVIEAKTEQSAKTKPDYGSCWFWKPPKATKAPKRKRENEGEEELSSSESTSHGKRECNESTRVAEVTSKTR